MASIKYNAPMALGNAMPSDVLAPKTFSSLAAGINKTGSVTVDNSNNIVPSSTSFLNSGAQYIDLSIPGARYYSANPLTVRMWLAGAGESSKVIAAGSSWTLPLGSPVKNPIALYASGQESVCRGGLFANFFGESICDLFSLSGSRLNVSVDPFDFKSTSITIRNNSSQSITLLDVRVYGTYSNMP